MTTPNVAHAGIASMLFYLRWQDTNLPAPIRSFRASWYDETSDREWRGGAIAELCNGQWARFYASAYEPPRFLGIGGGPPASYVDMEITDHEPPWRERGYEDRMVGGWIEFP